MLLIAAVLAARFVNWVAQQVTRRLDVGFAESDALVRSEATKHRQAVASVISWVSIVIIGIWVMLQITDILRFSVGGLIAPATVLGAALGFGAQQLVQDLLSGFFIIVEKQYGFGDLVTLTVSGVVDRRRGHRRERHVAGDQAALHRRRGVHHSQRPDREIGQPVQGLGARGGRHPGVDQRRPQPGQRGLHQECEHARDDPVLGELLLDAPTVMGVESIEVDTVTLRMVARTLPGKQFEAGRQLRVLVIRALARAGIVTAADATVGLVEDPAVPAAQAAERAKPTAKPRVRCSSGEVHPERPREAQRRYGQTPEPPVRRPGPHVDLRADRRVPGGVVGLRHLPPGTARQAAGPPGGAAGLRARPELHLGAAQPGAAAAGHGHGHADSDDHRAAGPDRRPTHRPRRSCLPHAAVPAAAALLPAQQQPRHRPPPQLPQPGPGPAPSSPPPAS